MDRERGRKEVGGQVRKPPRPRWTSGEMRGFPVDLLIRISGNVGTENHIGELATALRDRRNALERELAEVIAAQERVRRRNIERLKRNARLRAFAKRKRKQLGV